MIIQCGQCSTKFKIDDTKVTEAGVKVRCSKCKHIFVVKRETPFEEPDLDRILGGLGEEAAEERREEPGGFELPFSQAAGEPAPERPAAAEEEGGEEHPGVEEGFDFGSFTFGEEPSPPQPESAGETYPPSFELEGFGGEETFPGAREEGGGLEEPSDEGMPSPEPSLEAPPQAEALPAPEAPPAESFAPEFGKELEAGIQEKEEEPGSFDLAGMDFGKEGETPAFAAFPPAEEEAPKVPVEERYGVGEEELPPLSITSRRKGTSIVPITVTVISVLVILAMAAAGVYFLKTGSAALDRLGLGFLARWVGMEAEEGGIVVRDTTGAFIVNRESGELFVIRGEAVNNFKKPRASIRVKGIVYGPKGEVVMEKTAYCGNLISQEQLTTLPMAQIEAAMNNQFGDSLSNLGVKPGKGIPFVVVFANVPKGTTEFGVEIAGSTVASQ